MTSVQRSTWPRRWLGHGIDNMRRGRPAENYRLGTKVELAHRISGQYPTHAPLLQPWSTFPKSSSTPAPRFPQLDSVSTSGLELALLIPDFGCAGTWQSKPEDVINAVEYALKEAGYRHIDCAWCVATSLLGNHRELTGMQGLRQREGSRRGHPPIRGTSFGDLRTSLLDLTSTGI